MTDERRARWFTRKESESKRQKGTPIEPRLLYYADFYDLWEILKKNWDCFGPVFGEMRTIEVWMQELERLRDPNAHSRDLLSFQRHLALGISGDIRARIVRYHNKMENADDYFPRIESVRDSAGNTWPSPSQINNHQTLRVGDELQIVITATDPMGEILEYGYYWHPFGGEIWFESNAFTIQITEQLVGKLKELHLRVRSKRANHAYHSCDDFKHFHYDILPRVKS